MRFILIPIALSLLGLAACQPPIEIDGTLDTADHEIVLVWVLEDWSSSGPGGQVTPGRSIYEGYPVDANGAFAIEATPSNSSTDFALEIIWDENLNGQCDEGELVLYEGLDREADDQYQVDFEEPAAVPENGCPMRM